MTKLHPSVGSSLSVRCLIECTLGTNCVCAASSRSNHYQHKDCLQSSYGPENTWHSLRLDPSSALDWPSLTIWSDQSKHSTVRVAQPRFTLLPCPNRIKGRLPFEWSQSLEYSRTNLWSVDYSLVRLPSSGEHRFCTHKPHWNLLGHESLPIGDSLGSKGTWLGTNCTGIKHSTLLRVTRFRERTGSPFE